MPRERKRVKQRRENASKAREAKKARLNNQSELSSPGPSVSGDIDAEQRARSTSTDSSDPEDTTFDPQEELASNPTLQLEQYLEDWVASLDRDDRISLGLFLCYNLEHALNFTSTRASEYAAMMMGQGERTVWQWRADFLKNGEILGNKQGKYRRKGVLWSSEDLNKKARDYVRENANVRGKPNLTSSSFCTWINEDLLPNSCLEPGFPRKVSTETARLWLHHLGFEVLSATKGAYFDGHERDDVVASRIEFLRDMISIGFLHPDQAPTPAAQQAFPSDVPLASAEKREKLVVIFHDESTFNANDDQTLQWGIKGEGMLRPKSKGSGIMVSDFVDERNGYLALTDEEYAQAHKKDITIAQQARQTLEYGESREGYWNSEKFILQIETAAKIAEIKYPRKDGWKVYWVFDHSSCHTAMAEDALDAKRMNVHPGGKQPVMHDTVWEGRVQKLTFALGIPKGMKQILEERGICTDNLKADDMRVILSNHSDFQEEKAKVISFLESKGYTAYFLPKFHPELNPIERVWGQAKSYSKSHCNYSLLSLRKVIHPALDFVTIENIVKYHRKARDYMFAYFEGFKAGPKLEEHINKTYKSHRKVGKNS